MKFTVATTDVRACNSSSTAKTFDRQMTYYEDSNEYVFEFDTSACGTGSNFASTRALPLTTLTENDVDYNTIPIQWIWWNYDQV